MVCAHADKNHIKISREYVIKKHCLRTNRYLRQFYADKNHTKISGEYIAKICCLMRARETSHVYKDKW